jgi:hypothetical protein
MDSGVVRTRIRAERELWGRRIELLFTCIDRDSGRLSVAQEVIFKECADGELGGGPTISISNQDAQALMDDLWRCGFRPSEGTGSAGSLAATERHLKDMQAISKGLLKKFDVQT